MSRKKAAAVEERMEETEESEVQVQADAAIDSFSQLVASRRAGWIAIRGAGERVMKYLATARLALLQSLVSGRRTQLSRDYATFYGAYDDEKERSPDRMWPIRAPDRMPKPGERSLEGFDMVEVQDAAGLLLKDVETAVSNDDELLSALDHMKTEIVGMHVVKFRLISALLSAWTGGMQTSATGRNIVFGGNPGTGKTLIASVFAKIITLAGWIERPPSENAVVKELSRAIEHHEARTHQALPEPEPGLTSPMSMRHISRKRIETIAREEKERLYGQVPEKREEYIHVTGPEDYVAGYVGQTALTTLKTLKRGLGRMTFIDEAADLAASEFGIEALNVLLNWIPRIGQERLGLFAVAGYVDLLQERFFRRNEGLQSRFPLVYVLPNYTPTQLALVFSRIMTRGGWRLDVVPKEGDRSLESLSSEVQANVSGAEKQARERRILRVGAPERKRKEEGEEGVSGRWRRGVRPKFGSEAEENVVAFFSEFQIVFEIGNIRKVQNLINLIEELWAGAMIGESGEKTIDWLENLKERKVATFSMMADAMETLLVSSIGFEPAVEREAEKSEVETDDDRAF